MFFLVSFYKFVEFYQRRKRKKEKRILYFYLTQISLNQIEKRNDIKILN